VEKNLLPPTKEFCIADKRDLTNLVALLMISGAMCQKCGYGTRKTSKNWRRRKRPECGERIRMVPATKENVGAANAAIREAVEHA
jgi:hypothetical protein